MALIHCTKSAAGLSKDMRELILYALPRSTTGSRREFKIFKFVKMKKLDLTHMENIEGGSACLLAGAGAVLGVTAVVLSGGTVAVGVLSWGASMLGVLSACAKELDIE
ncbi:MAG: hypothetical protein QM763_19050 [Agriterribacter sp.]